MNKSSEKNLFEKYGNGSITEHELLLLHTWYFEQTRSEQPYPDPEVFKKRMEEMDTAVLGHLHLAERKIRFPKYVAAAFLLIAASFTFYFILRKVSSKKNDALYAAEIAPGGNKARLTLANGQSINLTNAHIGDLVKQGGVKITKTSEGTLIYTVTDGKPGNNNEYNTIETPKGGQYMVCLPDGTKVWLNAASTLKYPATFSSLSERRVLLRGEAYFEVFHNAKQPFIVQTDGQSVRDIGTKFNINSYAGEPGIKTSLLEGSVAVTPVLLEEKDSPVHKGSKPGDIAKTILKPGQQSVVSAGGIKIAESNVYESISWKNGFFQFQNDDLETGMRQISRWYNVEVKYEGIVPNDRLDGKVHRDISLSRVLEILLSPNIPYRIEGRKVIIMNK
jgi:transmembrane sensor